MKTFDTDDNNILSDTEIAAVKKIDCKGRAITNLKGIEYFTALEYLYCHDNELTELDLRRNTKLKELNCSTNRLTVLDLSQNPKLKMVICSDNALTALNLSSNSKLTNLNASGNIREITLTGNTFDLSSLPGFDASRMSGLTGSKVSGSTLTVDGNAAVVTYSYDLGYTGTELDDEERTLFSHWRLQDAARILISTRPTSRIRTSESFFLIKKPILIGIRMVNSAHGKLRWCRILMSTIWKSLILRVLNILRS